MRALPWAPSTLYQCPSVLSFSVLSLYNAHMATLASSGLLAKFGADNHTMVLELEAIMEGREAELADLKAGLEERKLKNVRRMMTLRSMSFVFNKDQRLPRGRDVQGL